MVYSQVENLASPRNSSQRSMTFIQTSWYSSSARPRSRSVLVFGVNVYGVRHQEEWQQHHFLTSTFKGSATMVITQC